MPERSTSDLADELTVLKRDIDDTLIAHYERFSDGNFDIDIEEVKKHSRRVLQMVKTTDRMALILRHYLSMAELRVAALKAVKQLSVARHPVDTQ